MTRMNCTHEEAFQYVQNRRFCVSPNMGFQRQIEAYESIHKAIQAVAQAGPLNGGNGSENGGAVRIMHRRKRGADEEGVDQDEADEELRERNLHAQRKRRDPDDDDDEEIDEGNATAVHSAYGSGLDM